MRVRDVIVNAPMTRPWVRLVLVFAGLAAIAAAGLLLWSFESRARAADATLVLADNDSRSAQAAAADLRGAQQAYVAVGQGEDFWFARVTSLTKDLDDVLAVFKGHLTSHEAVAAADEAIAAMQDFAAVDKRARDYTHSRQLPQASDVIFADGFDVTHKLSTAVARAIAAEAAAHDEALSGIRRREMIVLGSGAGVVALVLLLLIRGGAPKDAEQVVRLTVDPPAPVSKQTLDDLNDFGVIALPSQREAPPPPMVDLAAVAALCGDLARVTDTRAVPALLERAATVLDAAGIVLWIADPDGRELSPIVVHGYPPQIAGRLGTILRDATNVTASAYRTALLQIVKGDAVSNGAVAAPLVGAGGCLGVMAVEMKHGGEQREPLLAAAMIIASQLSTLVGPPSARARSEAAG
jgi:hypothetical protein